MCVGGVFTVVLVVVVVGPVGGWLDSALFRDKKMLLPGHSVDGSFNMCLASVFFCSGLTFHTCGQLEDILCGYLF